MFSTPKSRGELFLAASLRDGLEDNDLRQVETLLSRKYADPNVIIPSSGVSPFHLVIGNDSEEFAEEATKLFLRHGGDPNVRSTDGLTPVHVAAAWGRVRVLELLLANGGDPFSLDDENQSPFHYAFDGSHLDAVATLGKYCGTTAEEEREDFAPKYKLTLDKILINRGNVVAEYVPSDVSFELSRCGDERLTGSQLDDSYLRRNRENVTIRRYKKYPVTKLPEIGKPEVTSQENRLFEDEEIIGKCDAMGKTLSRCRIQAETSIISKSPNCRIPTGKETPSSRNLKKERTRIKSASSTPTGKILSKMRDKDRETCDDSPEVEANGRGRIRMKNVVVKLENLLLEDKEDAKKIEEKNYDSFYFDSPGSSNPISGTSGSRQEDDSPWDNSFLIEIDDLRCPSPPASVSFLETEAPENESIFSNSSDESNSIDEFYEADSATMNSWSPWESFLSVEEEYTYEDHEEGVAFLQRHLRVISSSAEESEQEDGWNRLDVSITGSERFSLPSPSSSVIAKARNLYDEVLLRERLRELGEVPGPITKTTWNVYLKRLWKLERAETQRIGGRRRRIEETGSKERKDAKSWNQNGVEIPENLLKTDWKEKEDRYRKLEEEAFKEYAICNPNRKYRGGISKTSFCYILMDPRITKDLPRRGAELTLKERWKVFLESIFYIGKGKAARPVAHLYDAFGIWTSGKRAPEVTPSRKIERILDIWKTGNGVVCLHVFSHAMTEEACTREASMILALGTSCLTNLLNGTFYGYATTMTFKDKFDLGKYLLYKAMEIFMHEGERQLFPRNVLL